jgi:hypothetical protein
MNNSIIPSIISSAGLSLSQVVLQEQKQANERKEQLGEAFGNTENLLETLARREGRTVTKSWLTEVAEQFIANHNKPRLKRSDKRNKTSLLCWFAENCQNLPEEFPPAPEIRRQTFVVPLLHPTFPVQGSAFADCIDYGKDEIDPDLKEDLEMDDDTLLELSFG